MDYSKASESIFNVINSLFSKLFSSIDNSVYGVLDKITFINTSIIEGENFNKIIGDSNSPGIILICNSLILGVILYYGINYLFSNLFMSKSQAPSRFFLKLIVFTIIMNYSVWICSEIINIVSIISNLILNLGKELFDQDVCFSNFINLINKEVYTQNSELNFFSFEGIAKSFTSYGFMNLVFIYSLRYILIQILVIISPIAILSFVLDKLEWIFKSWIKIFLYLSLEQILISVILLLGFSIDITNNPNLKQFLYIGIIFALLKTNGYMKQFFSSFPTYFTNNVLNN